MPRANPWLLILLGLVGVVLSAALTVQGLGVNGSGSSGSGLRLLAGAFLFLLAMILIGNGAWKLKQR